MKREGSAGTGTFPIIQASHWSIPQHRVIPAEYRLARRKAQPRGEEYNPERLTIQNLNDLVSAVVVPITLAWLATPDPERQQQAPISHYGQLVQRTWGLLRNLHDTACMYDVYTPTVMHNEETVHGA